MTAKRIECGALIITILAALGALLFSGMRGGYSATWGGMIVIGSFHLIAMMVDRLRHDQKTSRIFIVFLATGKLILLGALLWLSVMKMPIDPLAFLLGLSSIVGSIFLEGVLAVRRRS